MMCSGICASWRSRSLAIGTTSCSTNSRTERRISSCSGVTDGIVASLLGGAGIAFANQHWPLVLEHLLAALIESRGAKLHHPAVGARGFALGQHFGLRSQRIAGIDSGEELDLLVSQMGDRTFAEVLHRQAEDHVEHQQVIDDDVVVAQATGVFAVEVNRIEIHRHAGEQRVVALVDGAAPMMLEHLAHFEVFEVVSPFDFPDCHLTPLCRPSIRPCDTYRVTGEACLRPFSSSGPRRLPLMAPDSSGQPKRSGGAPVDFYGIPMDQSTVRRAGQAAAQWTRVV